jgi:hypothetical protein
MVAEPGPYRLRPPKRGGPRFAIWTGVSTTEAASPPFAEERRPSRSAGRAHRRVSGRAKLWIVLGFILAVLVVLRLLLPGYILRKVNADLADASPLYSVHIGDLDLHIWRMAYSFENVHGSLKKNAFEFLTIPRIDVAIAWRELFRGRFVADVDVRQARLTFTTETIAAVSGYDPGKAKAEAKGVKETTVPFDLERLRSYDSTFVFSDVAGLPPEQTFRLSHIDVVANNLTPKKESALSLATFSGAIQETGKIKGVAQIRPKSHPPEWSVNLEMRNFSLPKLNGVATRTVPVSFKSGTLSLFLAAQSVKGELNGYVKPFLKDVVFVGDHKDFKSVGHFFYEIAGTIGNFLLKNRKSHALATKVSFHTVNGKIQTDTAKAISLAVSNGFGKPLTQNLDDPLALE